MSYLEIKNLRKTYGCGARRVAVLENFSLDVAEGEFVAIVGRLGAGKTTLASLVAGLVMPDYGAISLAGKCVAGPGPDRGLVSQAYGPLAWLTVFDNVASAVDSLCTPAERRRICEHQLYQMQLLPHAQKKPGELTETQRRRLALARALAGNPDVLLLDDPLAGLADGPRDDLAELLARFVAAERKTCVLFTSDVDEALSLADRVVPLAADTRTMPVKDFFVDVPHPRKTAARNGRLAQLRAAVVGSMAAVVAAT